MYAKRLKLALVVALLSLSGNLFAAGTTTLPDLPKEWVNGGPYTQAGLKGKILALLFYEAG